MNQIKQFGKAIGIAIPTIASVISIGVLMMVIPEILVPAETAIGVLEYGGLVRTLGLTKFLPKFG